MVLTDLEKHEYTCKACGSAMTGDEVRHCEVCLKKRCPNCVVEIAGRTICTECKAWALEKLEEGLPLKPDGKLFASTAEIRERRKRELAQRLREAVVEQRRRRAWFKAIGKPRAGCLWPMLVFVGFVLVAIISADGHDLEVAAFFFLLALLSPPVVWLVLVLGARAQIMLFHYDDSSVESQAFSGMKISMTWTEVNKIVFGAKSFVIKAPGRRIKLRKNMFTHYSTIRDEIFKTGKRKGINCIWNG
jgi:hypothetical protein